MIGDGFHFALQALQFALGLTLALLPLAALGGAAWAAWRHIRTAWRIRRAIRRGTRESVGRTPW